MSDLSTDTALDLIIKLFQHIDAGEIQSASNILAIDFIHVSITDNKSETLSGPDWLCNLTSIHNAFPDTDHNLRDLSGNGNKVKGTFNVHCTHLGLLEIPSMGILIPPTGLKIQLPPEPFESVSVRGKIKQLTVYHPPNSGLKEVLHQLQSRTELNSG